MHAFLRAKDFRMVLATENKAYLCRRQDHGAWFRRLERVLGDGREVSWSHHYGERTGGISYVQRPDVLDHPVLLAIGESDVLSRGYRAARSPDWRDVMREVLPPVLLRMARRGLRSLRPGR